MLQNYLWFFFTARFSYGNFIRQFILAGVDAHTANVNLKHVFVVDINSIQM
jgi:hypothetical protein